MSLNINLTTPRNSLVRLLSDTEYLTYVDECSQDNCICLPLKEYSDLQFQIFASGTDFATYKNNLQVGIVKNGTTLIANNESGLIWGTITWPLYTPGVGIVTLNDHTSNQINMLDDFQIALFINTPTGLAPVSYNLSGLTFGTDAEQVALTDVYLNDTDNTGNYNVNSDADILAALNAHFTFSGSVTWSLSGRMLTANSTSVLGKLVFSRGGIINSFTINPTSSYIVATSNCFQLVPGCFTTLCRFYSDNNEFGFTYDDPVNTYYSYSFAGITFGSGATQVSLNGIYYNGIEDTTGCPFNPTSLANLLSILQANFTFSGNITWSLNGTVITGVSPTANGGGALGNIMLDVERTSLPVIPTITASIGFYNQIRLPFELRSPQTQKKKTIYMEADGTFVKLSSRVTKQYKMETDYLNDEIHTKISIALEHDHFFIFSDIDDNFHEVMSEKDDYKVNWYEDATHITVAPATCMLTIFIDEVNSNCSPPNPPTFSTDNDDIITETEVPIITEDGSNIITEL